MLSNKTYDTLKWITQYLLPGVGTLYFALADIWGLPYAEQVVGTITALVAFLGIMLGLSKAVYVNTGKIYDGELKIIEGDDKDTYSFQVNDLADLEKDEIRLSVKKVVEPIKYTEVE